MKFGKINIISVMIVIMSIFLILDIITISSYCKIIDKRINRLEQIEKARFEGVNAVDSIKLEDTDINYLDFNKHLFTYLERQRRYQ